MVELEEMTKRTYVKVFLLVMWLTTYIHTLIGLCSTLYSLILDRAGT